MEKSRYIIKRSAKDTEYLVFNSNLSDGWTKDINIATIFGYPDESLLRHDEIFEELKNGKT